MAETRRIRFLQRCGIGGMYFGQGAEADVPTRQASYFVQAGRAEFLDAGEKEPPADVPQSSGSEVRSQSPPPASKPARKRK